MPRINSQASNGPSALPSWPRILRMRAHSGPSPCAASAPAMTSEWPLRYLVAECMTMSAPSDSGLVKIGVATVESTQSTASALCAISDTAAMSVTVHSGLLGVSIQNSPVSPGRTAARTASRSEVSTKVTLWP